MYKQVIIVRNDLKLGKGKIAAQVAHAAVSSFLKTEKKNPEISSLWLLEGQKKVVLKIDSKNELLSLFEDIKNIFPCSLIKDAGLTQLSQPDITCLGVGPIKEDKIDRFTKKYKLL
ncbi:MAG: peptidyl-tRNA hydrolase Pth2 [Candidatus ainarchaeum sp.]|nr:peptidyl-tRNA hydrolase Pth2 [Candidatus ainarchaeum sp.]MDD3976176.1 peptidyl-tRNA hydrolase Pth2 [Candidatus ainarchaeum sp.]